VAGHIFQARPMWIYTQSNTTNIIFTWVHNTNTEKIIICELLCHLIDSRTLSRLATNEI
jgi:hypothetical protein